MFINPRPAAVLALCCAVGGAALTGCDVPDEASGPTTITVDGRSVNVLCSGDPEDDGPVIVLLAGFGDAVDALAGLQQPLSEENRVCSYDRLGEGASDRPDGTQSVASNGRTLTAVLDEVAGDGPVVLAGHSIGGLIAARYAPDHQDRVAGLVLMDATSPTAIGDVTAYVPEAAVGPAADVRAQMVAINTGDNPEQITVDDGEVRSAGAIPVAVIQHGRQDLASIPEYGPGLEQIWTDGQHKWLAVSTQSTLTTAETSGHYIYVDQPDLALQAIRDVTSRASDQ